MPAELCPHPARYFIRNVGPRVPINTLSAIVYLARRREGRGQRPTTCGVGEQTESANSAALPFRSIPIPEISADGYLLTSYPSLRRAIYEPDVPLWLSGSRLSHRASLEFLVIVLGSACDSRCVFRVLCCTTHPVPLETGACDTGRNGC